MEQEREVPIQVVQGISRMMSESTNTKEYAVDENIKTTNDLIKALKDGNIPGNAIIEWNDEKGRLRTNIIDFILYERINAVDPSNNEKVVINTINIPDGSWRLIY